MYDIDKIRNMASCLSQLKDELARIIANCSDFNKPNSRTTASEIHDSINKFKLKIDELDILLKTDTETYALDFKKDVAILRDALQVLFERHFFVKSKLDEFVDTKDQAKFQEILSTLLKIKDEMLIKITNSFHKMLSTCPNLEIGSAPASLPRAQINEHEIYGPIKEILSKLYEIIPAWAVKNNMNAMIWISGSLLDGVSPHKGLFSNRIFVAHKPADFGKASDLDIGIGLDRFAYGLEVPAHLQNKDKINLSGAFGQRVLSLTSESFGKDIIGKDFRNRRGLPENSEKKYLELIAALEQLSINNISLKDRQVHIQFFLIDDELPVAKELQYNQRKFIIFNNFKQPVITRQEITKNAILDKILKEELGQTGEGLKEYIREAIAGKKFSKDTFKMEVRIISEKFELSKKATERTISRILKEIMSN